MKLSVYFEDMYSSFDIHNNFILDLLRERYDVSVCKENPDYLFFASFGEKHLKYDCIKIFWTGENIVPDFNECDYAIGCHYINFEDRYLRIPLCCNEPEFKELIAGKKPELEDRELLNRKFCSFVVSNSINSSPLRDKMFHLLNEYKQVDSGGRHLNNIGAPVDNKHKFITQYKFNIAFENSSVRGYTTEKLTDPLWCHTIPIYWGNTLITKDFNGNALINAHDYTSVEDIVNEIIKIDKDDDAYLRMIHTNPFHNIDNAGNDSPLSHYKEDILKFFKNIFEQNNYEEARRIARNGFNVTLHTRKSNSWKYFSLVKQMRYIIKKIIFPFRK